MPKKSKATNGEVAEAVKRKKEQATFNLPPELIEQARNAVFWSPGWTLARLAERGLQLAITELQKKHNQGQPFPPRETELAAGRKAS